MNPDDSVAFFRQLQQLTTRIHATRNIDEIMLDLSADICALFGADRLTIYSLADDKASMVSKVKTGLASFKQLKLPISAQSIAGYVALSRQLLNLRDVYDESELKAHAAELCFQQGVDKRTGYRTTQMLVAPIIGEQEVTGVVQLINNRRGGAVAAAVEEGMRALCATLAIAFAQRHQGPLQERSRFVDAIRESVLPRSQVEHALRVAAATHTDIEDLLLKECGLKVAVVGRALADHFGVPYLGFHQERRRPDELLRGFNREFVLEHQWLPLEENQNGLYILCTDPEAARRSGGVARIFPQAVPVYCVTTRREFGWMVNQCFGQPEAAADAIYYQAPDQAQLEAAQRELLAHMVDGLLHSARPNRVCALQVDTVAGAAEGEVRFTISGVLRLA
jgi:hypothetical protein